MQADKKKVATNLKTARGQIDGILKMVEEDRYCVDISTQILSVIGILKKTNSQILGSHIKSCVATAIENGEGEEKIEEIVKILDKYL